MKIKQWWLVMIYNVDTYGRIKSNMIDIVIFLSFFLNKSFLNLFSKKKIILVTIAPYHIWVKHKTKFMVLLKHCVTMIIHFIFTINWIVTDFYDQNIHLLVEMDFQAKLFI